MKDLIWNSGKDNGPYFIFYVVKSRILKFVSKHCTKLNIYYSGQPKIKKIFFNNIDVFYESVKPNFKFSESVEPKYNIFSSELCPRCVRSSLSCPPSLSWTRTNP